MVGAGHTQYPALLNDYGDLAAGLLVDHQSPSQVVWPHKPARLTRSAASSEPGRFLSPSRASDRRSISRVAFSSRSTASTTACLWAWEVGIFTSIDNSTSGAIRGTTGHLLVVLEGHLDHDKPTDDQIDSLTKVMAWAADAYGIDPSWMLGHRHHPGAHTTCPGKHLVALIENGYLAGAANQLRSGGGAVLTTP